MSIVTSPRLYALDVTEGGRLISVVVSSLTKYVLYVEPGYAAELEWPESMRVAAALARLMGRIGELTKSDYYTYTGPVEASADAIIFRPFISTTQQIEVVIRGGVAEVPAIRRRFRTGLDVGSVIRGLMTVARYGSAGLRTIGVKVLRAGSRIG